MNYIRSPYVYIPGIIVFGIPSLIVIDGLLGTSISEKILNLFIGVFGMAGLPIYGLWNVIAGIIGSPLQWVGLIDDPRNRFEKMK